VYGGSGVGKSSTAFHIAKFYAQTNTPGKFYIADSDGAADRMIDMSYGDLGNIEVIPTYTWDDYVGLLNLPLTPDDWLVIDFISPAWQAVQDWYAEQVFGHDMSSQVMYTRRLIESSGADPKKTQALDSWRDWPAINQVWFKWMNQLIIRPKSHILAVAQETPLSNQDDVAVITAAKTVGMKPVGQKALIHSFHTVLHMTVSRNDYKFTTVKDREREKQYDAPMSRFPISYLQRVGGWKLEVAESSPDADSRQVSEVSDGLGVSVG
jgi:hypothetical protein